MDMAPPRDVLDGNLEATGPFEGDKSAELITL